MRKVGFSIALVLFLGVGFLACNRYFVCSDFHEKTKNHKIIAVLPFEMRLTGRVPKELTEEQILKIETAESLAFQSSFVNQILVQGNRGSREMRVEVQAATTTNKILEDYGIDIRSSWKESPKYLAELLEVDAVVRSNVIKQRYLSDLESIGVDVVATVLNRILRNPIWLGDWAKTAEVEVGVSLIEREKGSILFSTNQDVEVDWSQPANEAIESICRRVARKMPYSHKHDK